MTDTEIMRRGPATVSLSDEAGVNRFLVGAVGGLWSTVNDLTRLRPTRREPQRRSGTERSRLLPCAFVLPWSTRRSRRRGSL
jgi:hypothetical protein